MALHQILEELRKSDLDFVFNVVLKVMVTGLLCWRTVTDSGGDHLLRDFREVYFKLQLLGFRGVLGEGDRGDIHLRSIVAFRKSIRQIRIRPLREVSGSTLGCHLKYN